MSDILTIAREVMSYTDENQPSPHSALEIRLAKEVLDLSAALEAVCTSSAERFASSVRRSAGARAHTLEGKAGEGGK